MPARLLHELLEPVGLGAAIVVDEGDQLSAGRTPTEVPLARRAAGPRRDRDVAQPSRLGERVAVEHALGRRGVVVVHHNHLPAAGSQRLLLQGVQKPT